ncbi:MAG: DUF4019 domain-containing protein [Casimicrobiaceae bacterium]
MVFTVSGRRRALAGLALVLATAAIGAVSSPALAQDPQITAAQFAAREWLALSDAGDVQRSYATASPKFQATMTPQQWADASTKARLPYGAVRQRALAATQATSQVPNLPEGAYVLLMYRTSFANRDAAETITMERSADGAWRLVGYSIR